MRHSSLRPILTVVLFAAGMANLLAQTRSDPTPNGDAGRQSMEPKSEAPTRAVAPAAQKRGPSEAGASEARSTPGVPQSDMFRGSLWPVVTSIVAAVFSLAALWLVFSLRRRLQSLGRNIERLRQDFAGRIDDLSRPDDRMQRALTQLTQLDESQRRQATVLADYHLSSACDENSASAQVRRDALREVYIRFRGPTAELSSAVSQLEPEVTAVHRAAPGNGALRETIEQLLREYHSMAGLSGALSESEARACRAQGSAQLETQALRKDLLEGRVAPEVYLQRVLTWQPQTRAEGLPDPVAENGQLASLVQGFPDRFLAWLDLAAEIREGAASEAPSLAEGCTRLIAAARPIVLKQWQIEIDDVAVGSTRFDYRLHDMVISKPSPDVAPETVIAVHRLGHRRQGKVMRKPQVIVAAAASGG